MKHYVIELLGTALLVLAVLLSTNPVVIGGALAVALMATSTYHGAFNPAITALNFARGHLSADKAVLYVAAQVAGAGLAYTLYKAYVKA